MLLRSVKALKNKSSRTLSACNCRDYGLSGNRGISLRQAVRDYKGAVLFVSHRQSCDKQPDYSAFIDAPAWTKSRQ